MRFLALHCFCALGQHIGGIKKAEDNYLLQEPQDGITLQVRDVLLQIRFLISLVFHPVQHLKEEKLFSIS